MKCQMMFLRLGVQNTHTHTRTVHVQVGVLFLVMLEGKPFKWRFKMKLYGINCINCPPIARINK
jgi:hypothetical protein